MSDFYNFSITPQESAGAIASSAEDMAKWLNLLLNKGTTLEGEVVLNDTRIDEMMHPMITRSGSHRWWKPEFPFTYDEHSYGYAWMVGSYRGKKILSF